MLVLLHNELLQGSCVTLERLRASAPATTSTSRQEKVLQHVVQLESWLLFMHACVIPDRSAARLTCVTAPAMMTATSVPQTSTRHPLRWTWTGRWWRKRPGESRAAAATVILVVTTWPCMWRRRLAQSSSQLRLQLLTRKASSWCNGGGRERVDQGDDKRGCVPSNLQAFVGDVKLLVCFLLHCTQCQ